MARKQHLLNASRRHASYLVAALVLTGLSMRTAVTSVGAVLDELQQSLHMNGGTAGAVTTLPVICFAAIGSLTPRLSHRFGAHQLLVVALSLMTAGLVLRAAVGTVWLFVAFSVLALAGGAVSNILMPSLVKRHFPDRIGLMTGLYTSVLAIGLTAAAGLTVPIGELAGSWRLGLGFWALLSALAVLPWLPTLRHDRPDPSVSRGLSARRLVRSRTAWALAIFFAFQSFQAYIMFGWFARFLVGHGVPAGTAGWMVALLAAVSIPVSVVVPTVGSDRHRAVIAVLGLCSLVAYLGLAVAPVGGAWVWMTLAGVGSGMFPIALAQIGLRSRTAQTTAALSAFVQGIGYVIAGTGPLLFGVFFGATGSWTLPLALLFVALAITVAAGWRSSLPEHVDADLAESRA